VIADGSSDILKTGANHCRAAGRKNCQRRPVKANGQLVIYIFMNVPLLFPEVGWPGGWYCWVIGVVDFAAEAMASVAQEQETGPEFVSALKKGQEQTPSLFLSNTKGRYFPVCPISSRPRCRPFDHQDMIIDT